MRAAGGGRLGRGPWKRGSRVWQEALCAQEPCVCGRGVGARGILWAGADLCARAPWGAGGRRFCVELAPARAAARKPGTRGTGGPAWATGLQGSTPAPPGQGARPAQAATQRSCPEARRPDAARPGSSPSEVALCPGSRHLSPCPQTAARSQVHGPRAGATESRETNVPRARGRARDGRTQGDIWSLCRVGAARPEAAGLVVLIPSGPGRSAPPPGKPGRGLWGRGSESTDG